MPSDRNARRRRSRVNNDGTRLRLLSAVPVVTAAYTLNSPSTIVYGRRRDLHLRHGF